MKNANDVSVLGPEGTFTGIAAKKLFPDATPVYRETVAEIFNSVEENETGYGVVAIENSLEGSVGKTLDCLINFDLKICGEVVLDINLCLATKQNTEKKDIKQIVSHPHAIAQCQGYLKRDFPGATIISSTSTAAAMRDIGENEAAIGVKEAAEKYRLKILDENVQDDVSQTRFIAISKTSTVGDKTSVIFAVRDEPGSLYWILKVFADRNINLTKIESRPSRGKLGEYLFFMDFESGGMTGENVEELLDAIKPNTTLLKFLGSY